MTGFADVFVDMRGRKESFWRILGPTRVPLAYRGCCVVLVPHTIFSAHDYQAACRKKQRFTVRFRLENSLCFAYVVGPRSENTETRRQSSGGLL